MDYRRLGHHEHLQKQQVSWSVSSSGVSFYPKWSKELSELLMKSYCSTNCWLWQKSHLPKHCYTQLHPVMATTYPKVTGLVQRHKTAKSVQKNVWVSTWPPNFPVKSRSNIYIGRDGQTKPFPCRKHLTTYRN